MMGVVALEAVVWGDRGATRAIAAAVAASRALLVKKVLSPERCADVARAVAGDAPTAILVPHRGENIVSYARNVWTRRPHRPARLLGGEAVATTMRGQARLDLRPCFDAQQLVPQGLFGAHRLNETDSAIFVTAGGMRTPLHSDERHGMLLHVAGRKTFVLIPNADSDADAATLKRLLLMRDAVGDHAEHYPETPANTALRKVRRLQGSLDIGDALFIPQRWLHDIESTTPTISVSLRFGNWDKPNKK